MASDERCGLVRMGPRSGWLVSGETAILAIEELLIDKEGRKNGREETCRNYW